MAREDRQDDISNSTFTARSYALGSGRPADPSQTAAHADDATHATTNLGQAGGEPTTGASHGTRDFSLAGAGTGGAGAGYVGQDELAEHMRHGRDPEADQATYLSRDYYVGSSSAADPFSRPGHELYDASKGPAGVESAGTMAPGHIPGEFPSESGSDPHGGTSATGPAAAGLGSGAAGLAASRAFGDSDPASARGPSAGDSYASGTSQSPTIPTTTNTMRSGSFSQQPQDGSSIRPDDGRDDSGHKGALAAATTAMGLGGAGAYAASRDGNDRATSGPRDTVAPSQTSRGLDSAPIAQTANTHSGLHGRDHASPSTTTTTNRPMETTPINRAQDPQREDHTARNAGLATGAAAGTAAGAYGLSRDRDGAQPESVVSPTTQGYASTRPGQHQDVSSSGHGQSTMPSQSRDGASATGQSGNPTTDDHTARNAALGTGALGATGAGAYAATRDRDGRQPESVVSNQTQSYVGTHPRDTTSASSRPTDSTTSSRFTENIDPTRSGEQPTRADDHTGRNAALTGAGAGGLTGAAASALGRDGDSRPTESTSRSMDPTTSSSGPLSSSTAPASASGSIPGSTGPTSAQSVVSPETQAYTRHRPGTSDTNANHGPTSSSTGSGILPGQSTSGNPVQSSQQPQSDHTARNAALGAGAAGAGAYGLSRGDESSRNAPSSVVSPQTQQYTGSHPGDSSNTYNPGTSSTTTASQYNPGTSTTTNVPSRSAEEPRGSDSNTARNAALGAGGLGLAGAGASALGRDNEGGSSGTQGPASSVSQQTQNYGSHGPATGEAPVTGSQIPSRSHETSGFDRSTEQPRQDDSHAARNAALGAGGLGAAGAGAYALGRDNQSGNTGTQGGADSVVSPQTQGYSSSHGPSSSSTGVTSSTGSHVPGSQHGTSDYSRSTEPPRQDDHTARNAALGAGGMGAAGAGAYALGRERDPVGSASRTSGPHDSNVANTADPRVSSQPAQQYGSSTTGPHQSDTANRVDARVTSDPARAAPQDQGHHYGRDAAVVGGAGAAGYGAYEYAQRDQPSEVARDPVRQDPVSSRQDPVSSRQEPVASKHDTHKDPKPHTETGKAHHKDPKHETVHKHDDETHPDNRVAHGADGHNKLHKKGVEQHPEDNTGRNAALAGGTAAAGGAAAYGGKEYYDSKQGPSSSAESGEKKHGFLHKILHPSEHKKEQEEEERRRASQEQGRSFDDTRGTPSMNPTSTTSPATSSTNPVSGGLPSEGGESGVVTEPHTGLPMNVGKYGSVGTGGTDGNATIPGYHGDVPHEPRGSGY